MHVYVIIATDGRHHKECVVVRDQCVASELYRRLQHTYGGAHVSMWSREVDDVPITLVESLVGHIEEMRQAMANLDGDRLMVTE